MTPSTSSTPSSGSFLDRFFRFIIAKRWWVVAVYAVLLVPSVFYAIKVKQDNSLDRLIVETDPDAINARAFAKVFGQGEYVILIAEADDPFKPEVLKAVDELEQKIQKVPRVESNSALTVFRRAKAGFDASPEQAEAFKKFVTGTELFKKQGLVGDHFLGLPLVMAVQGAQQRHDTVAAVDAVIAATEKNPAPLIALRKVGEPYVNAYLDTDTQRAGLRLFPIFFLFVVVLNYALYRSFRTLIAFILTLGFSAAVTVGFIGIIGGMFTLVSALVPMTILITCTATLVYLQSRFVEIPPGADVEEHRIFALKNKFLASTASVFATAVGFAALGVSNIRPIREMGIWVGIGLVFTWITIFTLFPALQRILRTPTKGDQKQTAQWFLRLANWLPTFSYRYRWVLVPGALLMSAGGAFALFGAPGVLSPMHLETNALEYINHDTNLYKDTKKMEDIVGGLSITEVWLKSEKTGSVTDAEVVRGLIHFSDSLEADKEHIGAVIGLPALLRSLHYVSGQGDKLPDSVEGLEPVTANLETLLQKEAMLGRFVERTKMAQTHLAVITKMVDYQKFLVVDGVIKSKWKEAVKRDPALAQFELKNVGVAPLQAKISYNLVPTLTESFGLTVLIIFGTFLLVFRNGAARLMAMIPSLFAILVMFAFMRLFGISLSVTTILIASTVLGTSENDQIHFFYHFLEKGKISTEEGLKHTLLIAGRAIFFATLINAGGFLAFALADLPPMRHFGILSALAFILSMIADFTALPAALWMVFRDKPEALKTPAERLKAVGAEAKSDTHR